VAKGRSWEVISSGGFVQVELDKNELKQLLEFHKKLLENVRWIPSKNNPYQRIQKYMYISTKQKFKQEGISPSGKTKWWGKWTEKYRDFRVRIMKQPSPILQLDGTYRSKSGQVYVYNRRLIKSIKKTAPNAGMVMLESNTPYSWIHQKGSEGGPSRWGRGKIRGKERKSGLRDDNKKSPRRIKNRGGKKGYKRGAKSRRKGIPRRPYFIWIKSDITYVHAVFNLFWISHWQATGLNFDMQLTNIGGGGIQLAGMM